MGAMDYIEDLGSAKASKTKPAKGSLRKEIKANRKLEATPTGEILAYLVVRHKFGITLGLLVVSWTLFLVRNFHISNLF